MAMMLGALYQALLAGGVDEEQARKAAEEVATFESRFATIDTKLAVLTWMVGFLIALAVGNLWLIVSILERLPR